MATYYPKTSLSLRTTDANSNNKTFSVGYVNGDAPDGTLKELALKVVDLSNLSLREVYKTEQTDITTASTDTTVSGFSVASSSPFFSTDSDTYAAAFTALPATTGTLEIRLGTEQGVSDIKVTLANMQTAKNLTGLINLINSLAYVTSSGVQRLTASQITNGMHFETDYTVNGAPVFQVIFQQDDNAPSENVAAWLESVGENLIQVAGYTATYGDYQGMTVIRIVKE